jgi:hypothetical protein
MTRHKRRSELRDHEIARLVAEANRAHSQITDMLRHLTPQDRHYKGLLGLHNAIASALLEITGEEAPWCHVGPGVMPRPEGGQSDN